MRRDQSLRQLARDNRTRLERTTNSLQELASDALESAEGIDALSAAADEIQARKAAGDELVDEVVLRVGAVRAGRFQHSAFELVHE